MLIPAADFVANVTFPGCCEGVIGGPAFAGTAATGATACITGGPTDPVTPAIASVPGILFPSSISNEVYRMNDQFHSFVSGILQLMLRQRLII